MRFHVELLSREFILINTFNFGTKIYNFTIHILYSSIYLNCSTFPFIVRMTPKFTFRFLIPKYRIWRKRIFKTLLQDFIFKIGVFLSFFTFLGVFVNMSFLPNFCILKTSAPSNCGNEVLFSQKSYFIIKICTKLP